MYSILFVFIEGDNDQRFFNRILHSRLKSGYNEARYILYSQKTRDYVNRYVKSINDMNGDDLITDYVFVHDFDSAPCIQGKKDALSLHYTLLDPTKIIIVKEEIESWYVAGLNRAKCSALGLPYSPRTEHISKERLEQQKPTRFTSMNLFLIELLDDEYFDHDVAVRRNATYAYFTRKYL